MRLKIIQAGYTNFTGRLGTQTFTNGISDNDLTAEQAMHIASLMQVDWYLLPGVWAASASVALNAEITDGNGNVWMVTTAGTTGATQPVWPTNPTAGVTTQADNTVTWTFQQKADTGTDDVTNNQVNELTDQPTQTIPTPM